MQAILTKYLCPTNHKPARIKASCARGSIQIPCDYLGEKSHIQAAQALVDKFIKEDAKRYGTTDNPWANRRITGGLPNGDCCHVFMP